MKEGGKFIFVLGLFLVLSFNFVSAGSFSDIGGKFTGKVVSGESSCSVVEEGMQICTLYEGSFPEGISIESISEQEVKLRIGADKTARGEVTPFLREGEEYLFRQPPGNEDKEDVLFKILKIRPSSTEGDFFSRSVVFELTFLPSNEKNFSCSSGCFFEDTCYPYGYRIDDLFCSVDEKIFVKQFDADSSCSNSFQCFSETCVNNQCLGLSIWQKILRFFSRLF